jgi:hypothetical protein
MLPRAREGADVDFITAFPHRENSMDRSNASGSPQYGATTSTSTTTTTTSAPPDAAPATAAPQVHAAQPHLPQDVLGYIAACLIPDWHEAPGTPRALAASWPIGPAMRGLAAMSQACTSMRNAVAALRLTRTPHLRAFLNEAARREAAFRIGRGEDRRQALGAARQRYGHVPRMPHGTRRATAVVAEEGGGVPGPAEVWDSIDAEGRPALWARLVSSNDVEMVAERVKYRCDVLESLTLDLGALENPVRLGSAVEQCAILRKLSISTIQALHPRYLLALQCLQALQALSLCARSFEYGARVEIGGKLQPLPSVFDMLALMPAPEALVSLRLEVTNGPRLDMERFAALAPRLTALRKLAISPGSGSRTGQQWSGLQSALRNLPALEVVRFDDVSWECVEASGEVLAQHALLRDARYRLDEGIPLPAVTALNGHTGLERFDVESNHMIDGESMQLLTAMLRVPACRLRSLRVAAKIPAPLDVTPFLRAVCDYGKLGMLCLGPVLFKPDDAPLLRECIAANRGLRHLGLPLAGDAAAAAIAAALPGNASLWSIDLGDKPVGEEAAMLLADGLRGNRSVQQLRMNASAVSDATRQRIAESLASNRRG